MSRILSNVCSIIILMIFIILLIILSPVWLLMYILPEDPADSYKDFD